MSYILLLGFKENKTIEVEENDLKGPVPTVPAKTYDYYLLVSWLFLAFVALDFLVRKTKCLSVAFYLAKTLFDYVTNRNRQLELPQPPQRAMIQQNADNVADAHHNHPHHE